MDERRIDIHNPAEVVYWLKAFDASHAELIQAVSTVGTDAAAVSAWLRRGSDSEPPAAGQIPDGG